MCLPTLIRGFAHQKSHVSTCAVWTMLGHPCPTTAQLQANFKNFHRSLKCVHWHKYKLCVFAFMCPNVHPMQTVCFHVVMHIYEKYASHRCVESICAATWCVCCSLLLSVLWDNRNRFWNSEMWSCEWAPEWITLEGREMPYENWLHLYCDWTDAISAFQTWSVVMTYV